MNVGHKRTALMESVMSTPKDTKPSTTDSEGNSQYAFIRRWRRLADEIDAIRAANPKIVLESGYTDTYWDGSIGPNHYYEIAVYPAEAKIDALLKKEHEESGMGRDLLDFDRDLGKNG